MARSIVHPHRRRLTQQKCQEGALEKIAHEIPYGIPGEPLTKQRSASGSWLPVTRLRIQNLVRSVHTPAVVGVDDVCEVDTEGKRQKMEMLGYSTEWVEAVEVYLAINVDRLANYNSTICWWHTSGEKMGQTYARFALPITWDFAELDPFSKRTGGYLAHINWIVRFLENVLAAKLTSAPCINQQSSHNPCQSNELTESLLIHRIMTLFLTPDLADFFYVWLRRSIGDQFQSEFSDRLTPKSKELVQQHKTGERGCIGKQFYENGMTESFQAAHNSLRDDGRMVIVFGHKDPAAWETLTTAMIGAGLDRYSIMAH